MVQCMLRNTLLSFADGFRPSAPVGQTLALCRKSIIYLRICFACTLILVAGKSHAQQDYFVLLQADNSQPFYVKMGTKSFSSTAKGRLILSQLKEGALSFTIGFPRQLFPEQQWTINIDKDQEFQLKDLGEKGWGLFNPQTLELKAPDKKEGAQETKSEGIRKDDAFSRLMAGVVSDTAVMYNTYAMEEVLKDSPMAVAPVKKDTVARASIDSVVAATQKTTANNEPATVTDSTLKSGKPVTATTNKGGKHPGSQTVDPSPPTGNPTVAEAKGTVVKLSQRQTAKGLRLAYADRPKGKKADTIVVIIPMDTTNTTATANQSVKNPPTTVGGNRDAVTQTSLADGKHAKMQASPADGKHAKTQVSSMDSIRTETPPLDNSHAVAERSPADSGHNGVQTSQEPLFHTRTDTAAIVHTSSDTIHVYLAPRRKTDTTHLTAKPDSTHNTLTGGKPDLTRHAINKAKSDSTHNVVVNKTRPDSTHIPSGKTKPDIARNAAANKTRLDSAHNALNKGKPDLTHNTSGKGKADSAHNVAVNKGKPDATLNTAGKAKPDSAYNAAVNKAKPDTTHTTAVRSKPVIVNSDCRNFAADYDVDKLRVKMLENSKEEERIATAKKVFKTKCFTTRQIKALSEVFTTDGEKFRFFEAAYPFVSDDHFKDLTDLLADPVYNGKFKIMTGQR